MMSKLDAAQVVKRARQADKITAQELITHLFPDFFELHGDRVGGDDPAIIGGWATFHDQPVTVIITNRGQDLAERQQTHFGSPMPAGYRKALRLMQQAAHFNRPVLVFVNTPGAYPSPEAEEQGQGPALAQSILAMGELEVPVITVIYGEGGSGGALALAVSDQVWMLEYSTYAILSPEGFAAILWKDSKKAGLAAEQMQLTPQALLKQQVIEGIIPEPDDHKEVCTNIDQVLWEQLQKLRALPGNELVRQRHARFRKF